MPLPPLPSPLPPPSHPSSPLPTLPPLPPPPPPPPVSKPMHSSSIYTNIIDPVVVFSLSIAISFFPNCHLQLLVYIL